MEYEEFIKSKHRKNKNVGFDCDLSNSFLYDFQKKIIEFSLRRGKSAIFADCGLGKTPMQLEFARQIIKKTNGNVLIVTPLAVGAQTCSEAEKFGLDANKSIDGVLSNKITDSKMKLAYRIQSVGGLGKFDMEIFINAVS